MTFSYDPNLVSNKDRVRLLIGDRTTPGHEFEDEEILTQLSLASNDIYEASINLVESLIAEITRRSGTTTVGPFSTQYSEQLNNYNALLDRLKAHRTRLTGSGALGVLTGHLASEPETGKPRNFYIGMMDYDQVDERLLDEEGNLSTLGYI